MKNSLRILLVSVLWMTGFGITLHSAKKAPIEIKTGDAKLTVRVNGISEKDSLRLWVETSSIFAGLMENESHLLNYKNGIFEGSIPLELSEEIVGLSFEYNDRTFGSMLTLYQDRPIELEVALNPENNNFDILHTSDKNSHSKEEWELLGNITMRFYSADEDCVPDSAYSSWRNVRNYELNVMLPNELSFAFDNRDVPEGTLKWLKNNLLCRFAAIDVIPYVKKAERFNRLKVEEPPMEAYTFLDSIDYSDILLKRLPYSGLKSFLYALLRFPAGGFDKIGETPVEVWQNIVRDKLSSAIKNPTGLLLDLLAAMSYVEQIDINTIPLTALQIENIEKGFKNDLRKIIFYKNDRMKRSAAMNDKRDLSEIIFSLREFIDKEFPGRPVIVDNWNTWCAPCIDAIKKTDILRKDPGLKSDIVFLYLSDTTSPQKEWDERSDIISGCNLRLSHSDFQKIGAEYGIEALPSYILFNRNHELVKTNTGFPGSKTYLEWLEMLSK